MTSKKAAPLALFSVFSLILLSAELPGQGPGRARKFDFSYEVAIKGLSPGAHSVRVWIPLATSDRNQTVVLKKKASSVPTRVTREPEYGNRMLFAEIRNPKGPLVRFDLEYEVTRREYSKGDYQHLMQYNHEPVSIPASLKRFLEPDRLVPIDGKMKELAEENASRRQGPVEIARALYDYVFNTLRYDKSGTGWGRGDALWACDAKRGNCTDFHSLYIAMMRAQKIPARFEIGFPLPADAREGKIPGYHCWAEFYLEGAGWVPVDISEAWKDKSRRDYFFGTLDVNRVQFSVGRDLTLAPRQDGAPINYFVYPYVEVDGSPYDQLDNKFAFREVSIPGATGTAASR